MVSNAISWDVFCDMYSRLWYIQKNEPTFAINNMECNTALASTCNFCIALSMFDNDNDNEKVFIAK